MLRLLLITYIVLVAISPSLAQMPTEHSPGELRVLLQKSKPDTNRIQLLLKLGEHYLFKPGEDQHDLDSAFIFAGQAKKLSDELHYVQGQHLSLGLLGIAWFESGNLQQGRICYMQVINFYHQSGDKAQEAKWLTDLALWLPREDSNHAEKIHIYEQAILIYRQIKDKENEARILKDIADVHLQWGKLKTAENELLQVLELQQSNNSNALHYTYDLLAAVSALQGNFNKALLYALEMVKSMQATGDSVSAGYFYGRLGSIYRELGQTEKSIIWYKKALEQFQKRHSPNVYAVGGNIARALIQQGKAKEALALLLGITKNEAPVAVTDKEIVARALGDCFNALGQYDRAEKYYLEMVAWDEQQQDRDVYTLEAYYIIGKFYNGRQRYNKAGYYLLKALELPSGKTPVSRIKDVHLALFKVDSASGNYLSAIRHLQQHNVLNDSIFNETKSRQIAELQIQYETAKKEQDIQLLRNESQQAKLVRNVTFGGIAMLLAIVGLLYNRYRFKQRSNQQLRAQQKEINQQNQSLQNLVDEKDNLLDEKEWLLKEIHHRVKNNLQIVMSLLNTQSAYIENDAALIVIRENQHRVHAMSLIHQKLYQSDNVAFIDIPAYISELVDYLQDSFNTGYRIRFALQIAAIELDVAQTVPMGLILNEAITNAIKYAFPGNNNGVITIAMQHTADDHLLLTIADNGIGLPADFDIQKNSSLGMSLMQGLSKQLGGSFQIENNKGLTIMIKFADEKIVKSGLKPTASDLMTEIVSYE